MASKLLAKAASVGQINNEQAFSRYLDLLAADSDEQTAVDELAELMGQLGKSYADVRSDVAVIDRARELVAQIEGAKDIDAISAAIAKSKEDHLAAKEAYLERWKKKWTELDEAEIKANAISNGAQSALHSLSRLRSDHGRLLRDVPIHTQVTLNALMSPAAKAK